MSITILRSQKNRLTSRTNSNLNGVTNVSDQFFGKIETEDEYFRLDSEFLQQFVGKKPNFGFNGLGELVYYRTYSRKMPDGRKEQFIDTLTRVVEGCYEIQRRYCKRLHIPWDYEKAQESAQEMFQRMWDFKFLPPGRGLWMMGTEFMWSRGGAALNNCAYVSTDGVHESSPSEPFCFMMDMAMLGVGVGFDTLGADKIKIVSPNQSKSDVYRIPDSREGWVESTRKLIDSYTTKPENGVVVLDYSTIRPAGASINGFGGTASGPGILEDLHNLIREHLDHRINQTLSSTDIVDLMNYIGRCVVAGNVRRTAQLSLGPADDHDYRSMKNPKDILTDEEAKLFDAAVATLYSKQKEFAELSDFDGVDIDPDRLKKAIETWNAMNHHRWASNNSVFATVGMNYAAAAAQIAANGEPGFMWLTNAQDYGRMVDGRKPGVDGRVKGTNPCFSGNMRLFTSSGYRTLRDCWVDGGNLEYDSNTQFTLKTKIINNNGQVDATHVYRTSLDADLFKVTFSNGLFIEATKNHNFIVCIKKSCRGSAEELTRVQLSDLKVGYLVPTNHVSCFGEFNDPTYAELAGWCIGDGSLSPKADGQVRAQCNCYETDIQHVLPKIQNLLTDLYNRHNKSTNQNPTYAGWEREQAHFDHEEVVVGSNVLGRLLREDGVVPGDKHKVPASIWEGNKNTISAFLRGLFSADGSVQPNEDKKCISVRLSQSNKKLLSECCLLLNQFGIYSSIHYRKRSRRQLMNDGRGGKKWYNRQPAWELIISGRKQVQAFLKNIGFIQPWKAEIATLWLNNHPGSNNSNTGQYLTVKSIEYMGRGETFCLTEPVDNEVVVEGVRIGQCVEQSLESYELCCLVESFPANHENADDYMRTLKFAYLYGKTVTLLPTHNARTNQVMLRNRRIGLSQSGIVQAIAKFGRRAVLSDFCDAGYNEIQRWDEIYSEWLCVQRSIKVTSVKPSGSVSLLVGATPGIHYPEASTYWRRVRLAKDSILVKILTDAGYHIEPAIGDQDRTVVVKFAVSDERVRPVNKVSIWEQMACVVDYQTYWADNQVSATVKFAKHEIDDISRVLEIYEDRLKGISFLPMSDHGYAQAPYEPCTSEEVAEYNSKLKPADYSSYINEAFGSVFCDNDKCELITTSVS